MASTRTSIGMGPRFERWLRRSLLYSRPMKPLPTRSTPDEPATPSAGRVDRTVMLAGAVFGVVLPIVVAAALVPLRSSIEASTAVLVLVLPVVLASILGGFPAGIASAVSAVLAFNFFLTQPYYSLAIDAADDIEAALMLGLIALVVGRLVSREVEARSRAASRSDEVRALLDAVAALATDDVDRLVGAVTSGATIAGRARSCQWRPGYHGQVGQVLGRDGSLSGEHPDRAALSASQIEVPVVRAGRELGRLVLQPTPGEVVSREERLVVVALADLLAVRVPVPD